MRGVTANYPAFDATLGRLVTVEQRVNLCRVRHRQATPRQYESREYSRLTAFVAGQSRGMPIETGADRHLAPFVAKGRDLFIVRQGQPIWPAPIAMMTIGTNTWQVRRSRRRSRPAIRCTGWNGNRWDRDGCAPA
jgi:hypothetical protein